jgi:transposase
VINTILGKLRTGAPWQDLPERYGPWKTTHERLRRWTAPVGRDLELAEDEFDDAVEQLVLARREPVHTLGSRSSSLPRRRIDRAQPRRRSGAGPVPSTSRP